MKLQLFLFALLALMALLVFSEDHESRNIEHQQEEHQEEDHHEEDHVVHGEDHENIHYGHENHEDYHEYDQTNGIVQDEDHDIHEEHLVDEHEHHEDEHHEDEHEHHEDKHHENEEHHDHEEDEHHVDEHHENEEHDEDDVDHEDGRYLPFYIHLSSHNLEFPRLGYGTAGLGTGNTENVKAALESGIRLVDTAQAKEWYDEESTGNGIAEFLQELSSSPSSSSSGISSIDELTIVTKIHPRSFALEKMQAAVNQSKLLLYHDEDAVIDAVLLHAPYCWPGHCTPEEEKVHWLDGWRNLESIKANGEIEAIGVSNFDVEQLEQLLENANMRISVVQNWMDPLHQDLAVRAFCREHDIVYMAYSSFGTQWGNSPGNKFGGRNPVLTHPTLQQIAEKHGTTVASVVLSWLLQEEVIAIPRGSKPEHIHENASPIVFLGAEKARGHNVPEGAALHVILDQEDYDAISHLDGSEGTPWD